MTRTIRKIPPLNEKIEKTFLLKWIKIKYTEDIYLGSIFMETKNMETFGFLLRVFSLSGNESECNDDTLLIRHSVESIKTQYVYLNTIVSIEIDGERQKEFETDASGANRLRVKFWCNHIRDNIEYYMYTQ